MSPLTHDHTPEAIRARIAATTEHSYLGDGVLGAIDGAITTFAIVAGATGAGLSGGIALVLGLANVLADGFSMGVSNFLKAKSDRQVVERARRMEERHIDEIPEGEREEIREIFRVKGLEGDVLEEVVAVITRDRNRWVDTMLTDELGLQLETPEPGRAGFTTFLAFLLAGLIPLTPLMFLDGIGQDNWFLVSSVVTAATFILIGVIKARLVAESMFAHAVESLLIGGGAAFLAYFVGHWTRALAT
ncbi:MAG: VIT1/CCC1 transporter family protein [Planctomycetota bacterium]|jgi:VIT1/CCC1 family predicted Fe2+/Mn2+ transporter